KRGTLSMARTPDPDSATSQFFINLSDNEALNYSDDEPGYAVFAKVVEGMDMVDEIAAIPTGPAGPFPQDVPRQSVIIDKAEIISDSAIVATHFLADLHLQDDRGQLARKLHADLAAPAHQAAAGYVLGDLFDVWIGDDGSLPQHRATINAFAALAAAGTRVYFMRGNRDFAVGEDFFRASGMRLLPDPQLLDLYG